MPRYFLDLPGAAEPLPWDPHAAPRPERADTRYFGRVFTEMERTLRDPEIDVFLTWDTERLPRYGNRVVAVVLGDEVGRVPRYLDRVRAVFKCYGTRPALGGGPLRNPSIGGFAELGQWVVRWLKWLPGGAAHARLWLGRRARGRPALAAVPVIPLGTFNQVELPLVAIDERPTDVFFAGSVEHRTSLRDRLSPKARSRGEMLRAVRRLRDRRPDLRLNLQVTHGFEASASASASEYSRALMDSRVCLAPRGTSPETFRVFEGLRAGCVVVTEHLPRHPFYAGAPLIQLNRWRALDELALFDDPAEIRRLHLRALAWWREHCSEAAVGSYMAARLNGAPSGPILFP
jgi:hypothetical protein